MLGSIAPRAPIPGGNKNQLKPASAKAAAGFEAPPSARDEARFSAGEVEEPCSGHQGLQALMANFKTSEVKPTEKVEAVSAASSTLRSGKPSTQDPVQKARAQRESDSTGGSLKASKSSPRPVTPETLPPASSKGAPKIEVPRPVGQAEETRQSKAHTRVRQRSTLQTATMPRDRVILSSQGCEDA